MPWLKVVKMKFKSNKEHKEKESPIPSTFFDEYILLPKRYIFKYLDVIKGRSNNTVNGYNDLVLLFRFLKCTEACVLEIFSLQKFNK